jgi:hypothetical protein
MATPAQDDALSNVRSRTGAFVLLSRILVAIGVCAVLLAGYGSFTRWRMNAFGEERVAVVTRTWKEASTNFSYYRNGRVLSDSSNHAEIALLGNLDTRSNQSAQTDKSVATPESPFALDQDASHRAARLAAITGGLTAALQNSASTKGMDIPPDALRITVDHVSDAMVGTLFAGKQLKVKVHNGNAMFEADYKRPVSAALLDPFFVLGLGFLLAAAGVRYALVGRSAAEAARKV